MAPEYLLVGVLIVAAFGLGAFGIYSFANPFRSATDRLQDMTRETGTQERSLTDGGKDIGAVGKTIAQVAGPTKGEERDALRQHLIQAGYRGRNNVEMYSAIRFSAAVVLPLCFALISPNLGLLASVAMALVLASVGYFVPGLLVTNAKQKRQDELLRTFPDALDMLVASVEAGLGLDAAFRRVANEMEDAAYLLCSELKLVNNEVSAGVPRTEALKNLEYRTGLDDIASLVNVLIQAERFGTPVARSLRIHSEMVRTKRMQRAEEAAAKISPKLTVAMILFMLPCLIIILIGPAIVNVIRILLPAMAGK